MNPLLIPIVGNIASMVVNRLIESPATKVTQAEAAVVRQEVANAVAPVIEHLTNNEPWYQSRVSWGAIATILAGVSGIIMAAANGETSIDAYVTAAGGIFGGVITLVGRWKARKPLGA